MAKVKTDSLHPKPTFIDHIVDLTLTTDRLILGLVSHFSVSLDQILSQKQQPINRSGYFDARLPHTNSTSNRSLCFMAQRYFMAQQCKLKNAT